MLSNKLDICKYFLNIKVKKLNKREIKKLSKKKKLDYKLGNFISKYNQQQQQQQQQQNDNNGYFLIILKVFLIIIIKVAFVEKMMNI